MTIYTLTLKLMRKVKLLALQLSWAVAWVTGGCFVLVVDRQNTQELVKSFFVMFVQANGDKTQDSR